MTRMKTLLLLFLLLMLVGCKDLPRTEADQCLRAKLFKDCLESLPKGPEVVKYNDWDEVVEACGQQAYYQSIRLSSHIKPECR